MTGTKRRGQDRGGEEEGGTEEQNDEGVTKERQKSQCQVRKWSERGRRRGEKWTELKQIIGVRR